MNTHVSFPVRLAHRLVCTMLSCALVCLCLPLQAIAADMVTCAGAEQAESWRYDGGELEGAACIDTDELATDDVTGSSFSLMASGSYPYSTWKKSYGTSYLGIVKSKSTTTKVRISGVKRVGIDVSKWQGSINWKKVAAAGIDYAIIRCGYGSDKEAYDDAYFLENVEGALEAGLEIGVYLYSYATTVAAARSEASHALRLLDEAGLSANDLDLPVFYDMEDSTQAKCSKSKLGTLAKTFCNALEAQGFAAGVYASKSWWDNYLTASVFETQGWTRWVARYPTSSSVTETDIDDTAIWQFTSSGTVAGITGSVDVNFDFCGSGSYTLLNAKATDYETVKLTWSTVADATRYEVQRKVENGSWALLKKTKTTSCKDTGLATGTKYYYRIRALYETADEDTGEIDSISYSAWWRTLSATPKLSAPTVSSLAINSSVRRITVKWKSASGASGYEIYRAKGTGSYKKVRSVSSSAKRTWKSGVLSLGKTYKYKVRAYRVVNGKKVYGPFSSVKKLKAVPSRVSVKSVSSASRAKAIVKWKKAMGATRYQVAYRIKGTGTWHYVTVKSTHKTFSGLRNKRYYVKVRAYKSAKGKKYYGAWSATKLMKVK